MTDPIDAALQAELAKAEAAKAGAMALLTLLGLAPVLVAVVLQGQGLVAIAAGVIPLATALISLLLLLETGAWRWFRQQTAQGRPIPRWTGALLVAVEALVPTALLALIARALSPDKALTAPQLLLYGVFIVSSALRLDPRLCLLSGGLGAASYALFAGALLAQDAVHDPLEALPITHFMRVLYVLLIGVATALLAHQVRARAREALRQAAERSRVVGVFGRYLHEEVVDLLLHSPDGQKLGGQRRTLTVMMTDLRGFSALSEREPPERVMAMLNHYLGVMIPIIVDHGGTIDEIIGDAILVLWGAPLSQPDHARRAIAAALAMQAAMAEVNRWCADQGLPDLEMGIGLHCGEAVVGNIGAAQRQKYGVVGSTINMAARVESATVGGQILATTAVIALAGPGLQTGPTRSLHPKGALRPLEVVELRGLDGQTLSTIDDPLSPCPPRTLLLRPYLGKDLAPHAPPRHPPRAFPPGRPDPEPPAPRRRQRRHPPGRRGHRRRAGHRRGRRRPAPPNLGPGSGRPDGGLRRLNAQTPTRSGLPTPGTR